MARIDDLYAESDRANGLPPGMTRAIAQAETGHIKDMSARSKAVSPKGAQGWMQFMPSTAAAYDVGNPFDPEQAIPGAGRYLGKLAQQFGGNPRLIAAAYNAGENRDSLRAGRVPEIPETQNYVQKVVSNMGSPIDPFDELEQSTRSRKAVDPFDELMQKKRDPSMPRKSEPVMEQNPTDNLGWLEAFKQGAIQRGNDRLIGAKQALNIGNQDELTKEAALAEASGKRLNNTSGGYWGGLAADVGGGLALGGLGTLAAGAAGLASPVLPFVGGAAGGALSGLLEPTTSEKDAQSKVEQGAIGGLLGSAVGPVLSKAAKPIKSTLNAEGERLAQKAAEYGINLTPAMLTGSKPLKWLDAVFADLPGTAGKQQAINSSMQQQFNRAISKTYGAADDLITPSTIKESKDRIGGMFQDLSARNRLTFDSNLLDDVTQHQFDALRYNTGKQGKVLGEYIDDLLNKVEPDGTVSGEAYRKLDSAIGKKMRETGDGDLRHTLGDFRDTVRGAMDRSISPEDAAAWKEARRQYAAMKTVEPLANKATMGDISEGLLLNQANKGGNADLKELGRIGKAFLQDMPSSGTAQRTFMQNLINSPVATIGGAAVGIPSRFMIQNTIHSPMLRDYLTRGLLDENSAKLLGRSAGLLGTPIGINLLQPD